MPFLSKPRRRHRSGEWDEGKVVTFIVTLAATGSVTLAARKAGMSRKGAYALKVRDPAFAAAWIAASEAAAAASIEGGKVEEVEPPRGARSHVHTSPSRAERERAFSGLVGALRDSAPLAPGPCAQ